MIVFIVIDASLNSSQSVAENIGIISVCVLITSRVDITRQVRVWLSTESNTAIGMFHLYNK